ncbi:MAG TPA: AMP-binding protein [Vicinamibacterales bacterium]
MSSTRAPGERPGTITTAQAARLHALLAAIDGRNPFYTRKLRDASVDVSNADPSLLLERLPFTTKAELVADQQANGPWGTALTEPFASYVRYNQTSSTTGRPLRWLDTPASWQWALECWKAVYAGARVTSDDRIFFPFSFGPFLGFWTAFDAGEQIGALCVPGGGMSSEQRIAMIDAVEATVVCCTPTYALRLAEVAESTRTGSGPHPFRSVRAVIVAGEPGGSVPAVRERIESRWETRVIDHYGLTEVGPVAFECWEAPGGLHVNEDEFIAEVLDAEGRAVPDGETGELVLTNLGRIASPVIRYRTGDIVRPRRTPCACGRRWLWLDGGIVSRADDMINVRGVNVYPAAIEALVRQFEEVVEFRTTVSTRGGMRALSVEIELSTGEDDRIAAALMRRLRESLSLAVPVRCVPPGTLPRFEMKARRFVRSED